ncbi:hypothetical protein WEI85_23460 [Actinomycetes bacterium KLBMP 9797]
MWTADIRLPDVVPVLSRGKHRNPRKGACFMELASFLAGEPWSDHPACTHPLLAGLARLVNDFTTDAGRQRLAPLVPSVIGLAGEDPHVDALIAQRAATTALPVVSAERQNVLAVSVLACDRVLADLDGRRPGRLNEASRAALAQAPHAARWAERFADGIAISPESFRRRSAPMTVEYAVEGIARACVDDPDGMLYGLLRDAITDAEAWLPRQTTAARPARAVSVLRRGKSHIP